MKYLLYQFFILVSFISFSQNDDEARLAGTWLMDKVIQRENDVSEQHNPEGDRYIIFNKDGTFESGGAPYGKNTGKYYFDVSKKRLMLDSDAGEGDDSMWEVKFEEGRMFWKGIGSEWAENFRIEHRKAKT